VNKKKPSKKPSLTKKVVYDKGGVTLTLYPEVTKSRLRAYLKARKWPKKDIDEAIKELWQIEDPVMIPAAK
jgi:histidyl-tRNA synthetase